MKNRIVYFIIIIVLEYSAFAYTQLDSRSNNIVQGGYWPRSAFDFYLDKENELPYVDNEEDTIAEALNLWTNLSTSYVELNVAGFATRAEAEDPNSGVDFFIYFDEDGSMIEEMGLDPNTILGLASSTANTNGEFESSLIILNGSLIYEDEVLRTTISHEIGHFLGLDHSTFYYEGVGISYMYPYEDDDIESLVQDDISGMSSIYPEDNFSTDFGAITGAISFADGAPAFGADIVAIDAKTLKPVMSASVGFPSCFGNEYVQSPGEYMLPGLPPGDYYLKVHSYPVFGGLVDNDVYLIEDYFVAKNGSSIGIYDFENFVAGFPTSFYPHALDINDGDFITVPAGKLMKGINMNLSFKYNPSATISFYHESPTDVALTIAIGSSASGPYDFSKQISFSDPDGDGFVTVEVDLKDASSFLPPSTNKKVFLLYRDTVANGIAGALLGFSVYVNKAVYYMPITSEDSYFTYSRSTSSIAIDGTSSYSTEKFTRDIGFDARCNSKTGTKNADGVYYPLRANDDDDTNEDDDEKPEDDDDDDTSNETGGTPAATAPATDTTENPQVTVDTEDSGGCMLMMDETVDSSYLLFIVFLMIMLLSRTCSDFKGKRLFLLTRIRIHKGK